ncbi:uncharacterized protein FOMMEDRAFT_150761 [Fomitiporia mediterranea MF3/22]|uniref:uncharacterized protein n=1 Tax=Fomitiporia mediterranea (strain MF3/22) TaxID=694068 RepID=UPI0004408A5B|nr:uncharacterized protein FOMMEDRAFT_150761 [Fomitiporia mediterranea MF3/22]EJD08087.1 hypothetical protein FOMMEDRAFT_150761 [Fomitiporia mediterranea MF3/22]
MSTEACRDINPVDALISVSETILGQQEVPSGFNGDLERLYRRQCRNGEVIQGQMDTCLYMGSYEARWLALICHTNCVFFRLHSRNVRMVPFLTCSTVEQQENTTRLFHMQAQLVKVPEEDKKATARHLSPGG